MITLRKQPYWWTPAHAPVVFEFDYEQVNIFSFIVGLTPNLAILPAQPFTDTPQVGGLIYFVDGKYKGYHTIKSYNTLFPGAIETNTPFTGDIAGSNSVRLITQYEFELYKGFPAGGLFADSLPLTKLATFVPEPNTEGILSMNLSGYLKGIFDPTDYKDLNASSSPQHAGMQWATGLFNSYRLIAKKLRNDSRLLQSSWLVNYRMILNAHTDPEELMRHYWRTGANLTKELPSVIFANCDTMVMKLEDAGVLFAGYEGGQPYFGEVFFTDSFTDSFKKQMV